MPVCVREAATIIAPTLEAAEWRTAPVTTEESSLTSKEIMEAIWMVATGSQKASGSGVGWGP